MISDFRFYIKGGGNHEKDADRFSVRNVRAVIISSSRSPKATDRSKDRLSASAGGPSGAHEVFRRSLRELGYAEDDNIVIEYRSAEGRPRLLELANELVREKVEMVVASGGPAARSAKDATKTIPIVFASSGEPVEGGFVNSIARPGGNMTGMSWLSFELVGKRLELLKEAVPRVSRVAIYQIPSIQVNNGNCGKRKAAHEPWNDPRLLSSKTSAEFDAAYDAISKQNVNGLLVFPEAITLANRLGINDFAAKHRLPSMLGWKKYVEAGGLMSYGPNRDDHSGELPCTWTKF